MTSGVQLGPRTAERVRLLVERQTRDLVGTRRRVDVGTSPDWLIPARVLAVYGTVNAAYDVKATTSALQLDFVTPHDRVFDTPPAEFAPVVVGAPCFIARFLSPTGDEDEYYLWSLHEKCKTATCGGSP